MLNSIILLGGLVSAFGLGAISPNQEKQDNVNFRLENHKSVSYDDEEYKIYLNDDEVGSYSFYNLYQFILSENNFDIVVANDTYEYDDFYSDYSSYVYADLGGDKIFFVIDYLIANEYWDIHLEKNYVFYSPDVLGNPLSFRDNDFYLTTTPQVYSSLKQAIELDIQANSQDINGNIFETLTDSVVAFVGSLGSGIVSITDIFYDSVEGNLTVIGLLSVIVVAVSLTYFLFRLIIGLIRMRG